MLNQTGRGCIGRSIAIIEFDMRTGQSYQDWSLDIIWSQVILKLTKPKGGGRIKLYFESNPCAFLALNAWIEKVRNLRITKTE